MVRCVVWCDVAWYGMIRLGVICCDVMWCGVMWYGVVWCDVMWYGVVWYEKLGVTENQRGGYAHHNGGGGLCSWVVIGK